MLLCTALALAGCGDTSKLLDGSSAQELQASLSSVQQAAAEGRCEEAAAAADEGLQRISALPSSVDAALKRRLRKGFQEMKAKISDDCTDTTKTETTPEVPSTTETTPEVPPTTETTPETPSTTETTPETPTETTPSTPEPDTTTSPDGSGGTGSGGTSGARRRSMASTGRRARPAVPSRTCRTVAARRPTRSGVR